MAEVAKDVTITEEALAEDVKVATENQQLLDQEKKVVVLEVIEVQVIEVQALVIGVETEPKDHAEKELLELQIQNVLQVVLLKQQKIEDREEASN